MSAATWAQTSVDSIEPQGVRFGTGGSIGAVTERVRISQNGLMGIGTQSPTSALQVSGTFTVSSTVTGANPALYVSTSGNVGIGTNTPSYRLDVVDVTASVAVRSTGVNSNATSLFSNDAQTYSLGINGANSDKFLIYDVTRAASRIAIDTSGSVGIGTLTPTAQLHVSGTVADQHAIYGRPYTSSSAGVYGASQDGLVYGSLGYNNIYSLYGGGSAYIENSDSSVGFVYNSNASLATATSNTGVYHYMYPGNAGYTDTRWYTERYGGDSYWRWLSYTQFYQNTTYRGDLGLLRYANGDSQWVLRLDGTNGYVRFGDNTIAGYRIELPDTAGSAGRGRANSWVTYSDGRFKTDVKPIEHALDKVVALQGVTYRSKLAKNPSEQIGFIAQDVEKQVPQIVSIASTTVTYEGSSKTEVISDYRSLDYARLVPVLVEAIKELKANNDSLRTELRALKQSREN